MIDEDKQEGVYIRYIWFLSAIFNFLFDQSWKDLVLCGEWILNSEGEASESHKNKY